MRHLLHYKNTPSITMPLHLSLCKDQSSRFPSRHPHRLRSRRRIPYRSMSSRDLLSRSSNKECATGMFTLVSTLPVVLERSVCIQVANALPELCTNSFSTFGGVFCCFVERMLIEDRDEAPFSNHGQFQGLKLVLNPPNLQEWRERLFHVDEMITLTEEQ